MKLWGRGARDEKPEPVSDRARLEQLLLQLADDIAADGDDRWITEWSRQVRGCAALVAAGKPGGLWGFLGLFDNDPRNTINEHRFTRTSTFAEAMGLASKLSSELAGEEARLREAERGLVLRPWTAGTTGKAVVYADGTVVTCDTNAPGEPQFDDIKIRPKEAPEAVIGIAPDGSCDAYRSSRDERWLAARLHKHDPRLHLKEPQTPG
jgi:hypothetical protein